EPATVGMPRLAVLDLALVAPDSSEAWLSAGISEEVSLSLSRFTGIRVKSRGAIRDAPRSGPIALGRRLSVDYLVEGNVQRAGDRLKVGVRLTSTRDGFQVWGHEFDAAPAELPELHHRIASLIAARVGGTLATSDSASALRRLTSNPLAYEHYLRGTYLLGRRTPVAVEQAIAQFQRAFALDSTFAAAPARIAYGYYIFLEWGWSYRGAGPDQLLRDGMLLVDQSLATDSSSAEAWLSRAYLLVIRDPVSMRGAPEAFEHALSLDPRSVETLYQYAQALMALGRWPEARVAYRRAIALEPERGQTYVSLGSIERKEGFPEVARRLYDSALIVEPGASYARAARSRMRLEAGDVAGALDDAQTAVRTTQGYTVPPRAALAAALYRSGDTSGASREIEMSREAMANPGHPSPTDVRWVGAALIVLGRKDEALDLLERARPRGAWLWFYFVASEFDPVRHDPRFIRVMREARPGYPGE
ncbi:MAG TPA: tetratricopeptide repeat protein, partial [Gemmatimonadales bacterium]|nr:tetratricopeptide repeat protein [Gemmatimonadales bacterium]